MHKITRLPLHNGKAPRWLFSRMKKLGYEISIVIIDEFGANELLRRLTDPNWFQALACTLGYDWHSSGTTTVTMAALKEVLNSSKEIFIAGGKGKAGINTPNEIREGSEMINIDTEHYIKISKLAAKIDSALIFDNLSIYHHNFLFTKDKWGVIQQGMLNDSAYRFQWFSDFVNEKDIANEPHTSIYGISRETLDLTYKENKELRDKSVDAIYEIKTYPNRHYIIKGIDISKRGLETIKKAQEIEPKNFNELLEIKGIGRETIKSIALISNLIYGTKLAYRDPITFSYNVGGKDGIPYPINKRHYDSIIEEMKLIIDKAHIDNYEKYIALKQLNKFIES